MRISDKWKAVVGAIGGFVATVTAVTADNVISLDEAGEVIAAGIGAGVLIYGLVWAKRNKPTTDTDKS